MSEESSTRGRRGGFANAIAKKALAPIVASTAAAATAYLMRKGAVVWQEKLLPKIDEKGGGRAVAKETLENAVKIGGPASDRLRALAGKLSEHGPDDEPSTQAPPSAASDTKAEQERRKREQRRKERRRSLEQAGSS